MMSFNINGIRARPHQLDAIYQQHRPDFIGLQETKVHDDQFPAEAIREAGYHVAYHGQKGHYGVALLSLQEPQSISRGFEGEPEDAQRRMIMGRFKLKDGSDLVIINGYFPQGENRNHPVKFPAKLKYYEDLQRLLENDLSPKITWW